MISRIEGVLAELIDGRAMLACAGGITYELLVPGFDQQRLAVCVGQNVTFHTLHYLEAQGPTGPFIPIRGPKDGGSKSASPTASIAVSPAAARSRRTEPREK